MLSRRNLLRSLPIGIAALGGSTIAAARSGPTAWKAPRYVLQIVLVGGIDAVFFTDPKERSEVDADVDVPYAPDAILTAGRSRFGPLLAPLAPWASRITVVNGVWVGTANHPAGRRQILALKQGSELGMPAALELIGSRRDGQALGCVYLTSVDSFAASDMSFSALMQVDATPSDDLRLMARVARERAGAMQSASALTTRTNIEATADFFERVSSLPRFKAEPPLSEGDAFANYFNAALQRAHWLFKHDLARCAIVGIADWDTHTFNTKLQTIPSKRLLPKLADFLALLESSTNQHGSLLDNTLVIVSSELGRHPVLNPRAGKDHLPEIPMLFINAGGAGNTFGRTGRRMQALPWTGRKNPQVSLTDVGATVLRLGGVNPETCGYRGEPLDFLGVG